MTDPAPEIPVPLPTNYTLEQAGHVAHHNKLGYLMNQMAASNVAAATTLAATTGSQTSRVNEFLATAPSEPKRLVGNFVVDSTVTVPAGAQVDMSSATITVTNTAVSAFTVGTGATIRGGVINSPAAWNGTNTAWTVAVVYVTGDDVTISDLTLNNVHKVGIGFRNVDGGIVKGCRINGNYPSASWTEMETAHFGITIDPGTSAQQGNFVISDNIIRSCVQGVYVGNFGSAAIGLGITVTGNVFNDIFNHGVYASSGAGYTVSGNAFSRTQIPIALTGSYHSVTGNTMVTTSTGDLRDKTGISMRNSIGCTVIGNTIKGEISADTVVVSIDTLGGTVVRDNVIAHNVIETTGTGSMSIRLGNGATTCENNIVQGNRIRGGGASANAGVIHIMGTADALGKSNQVLDNSIVVTSNAHGIQANYQSGLDVRGNRVRVEYDAGAAFTLAGVALNTVTEATVESNDFSISSAWGTNIAVRGIWEQAGCSNNRLRGNRYRFTAGKVTSITPLVVLTDGGVILDETLPGAPAAYAAAGSVIRRTDGGAGTSFYVKESSTGATGWTGK